MMAIVQESYGPPHILELREVDMPEPEEGEVLVRVHAASLNTADLDHLRGRSLAERVAYGFSKPRNSIPGFDMAGEVVAIGEKVTRLQPLMDAANRVNAAATRGLEMGEAQKLMAAMRLLASNLDKRGM